MPELADIEKFLFRLIDGSISFVLLFLALGAGLRLSTWLIQRGVERRRYLMHSWNTTESNQLRTESDQLRTESISRVLQTAARTVFGLLAIVVVLDSFGVDLGQILASVSLVSIAIGFGAQYLVRDYLSGILIISEDQYRVGDDVEINKIAGTVDDMRLRLTVLRDDDGTLHQIPNGEIRIVSNRSRESTMFDTELRVGYDTDLRQVVQTVDRIGVEISTDPQWKDLVRQPIHASHMHQFTDEGVIVRLVGEAQPNHAKSLASEVRRRLDDAFAQADIVVSWQ